MQAGICDAAAVALNIYEEKLMQLIINIMIVVVLTGIAVQDFRLRAIHWLWIPALAALFVVQNADHLPTSALLFNLGFNLAFLLLQAIVLTIWFSMRERKFTNIIDRYIGLGDILFFVALAFAFEPVSFVLVFTVTLLFSLIGYGGFLLLRPHSNQQIPLAGLMAIPIAVIVIVSHWSTSELFSISSSILSLQ